MTPIRVDSKEFDAVLLAACRASVLVARVEHNEPTGIEHAKAFEEAAGAAAWRIKEMLTSPQAPDGEEFARKMGWPSRAALVAFLYGGASADDA